MILYKYLPLTWADDLSDVHKDLFRKRCDCISENRFWFSKPDLLNDPFDCRPFFTISQNLESIKAILDEMEAEEIDLVLKKFPNCKSKDDILNLFEKIMSSTKTASSTKEFTMWVLQAMASKLVQAKIANIGVLSLTTDPSNILMWAQYANNHKGICLEVNIPEDTHSLKNVNYHKQQPDFAIHEAVNEKHGRLLDLFYTKSKDWKHEAEWRMVAIKGNEAKEIPGAVIKKIICGINFSNETKMKMAESIGREISTNQLRMKRNYKLYYGT
jgi:hypothetical protein